MGDFVLLLVLFVFQGWSKSSMESWEKQALESGQCELESQLRPLVVLERETHFIWLGLVDDQQCTKPLDTKLEEWKPLSSCATLSKSLK